MSNSYDKKGSIPKTFQQIFSIRVKTRYIYGNESIWLISLVLILNAYAFIIIIDKLCLKPCENSVIWYTTIAASSAILCIYDNNAKWTLNVPIIIERKRGKKKVLIICHKKLLINIFTITNFALLAYKIVCANLFVLFWKLKSEIFRSKRFRWNFHIWSVYNYQFVALILSHTNMLRSLLKKNINKLSCILFNQIFTTYHHRKYCLGAWNQFVFTVI